MQAVAGRHPLKQGLKLTRFVPVLETAQVAGRHPLKQGLKLFKIPFFIIIFLRGRRAASTKTRIETFQVRRGCGQFVGRRAASTKTRIETRWSPGPEGTPDRVAGRHPLKQGLKPRCFRCLASASTVAGRHPLKQGLKLEILLLSMGKFRGGRRAASTKTRIETVCIIWIWLR